MPTLLCHIAWMPSFAGENDVYPAGFDYVREEGYGHEILNFKPFDGFYYGYVPAHAGTINITRIGANNEDTFVDDVTIIWTATPPQGGRVVVGWYRGARIYRRFQRGMIRGREFRDQRIGYCAVARAEDCMLIAENKRDFSVPYHGRGLPGESSVFYPEDSEAPEMQRWLPQVAAYMSARVGSHGPRERNTARAGWASPPDAAHNAAVEAAAIAFVRRCLVTETRDRQKDYCGWDLEFAQGNQNLCVEVKGLSGGEIRVELTPNEYQAMQRAVRNDFPEGEYRLAVVCNALTDPKLFLFAYSKGMNWVCELTSKIIRADERVAARLAENV